MADLIRIVWMPGSPYSRKMRAILRYRRIPHAWVTPGAPEHGTLPRPRVELLPQTIRFFYGRATPEMATLPFSLMRGAFCARAVRLRR